MAAVQTPVTPVDSRGVASPTRPWERPWWLAPVLTVVGLGGFVLYSLWSVVLGYPTGGAQPNTFGTGFTAEPNIAPYLSPLFSPLIQIPGWPLSPAILVMWIPVLFRVSCYYYRKAYYRSFFWDPPACAIAERPGRGYVGETHFPYILNNAHRYFFYLVNIVLIFLWIDAIRAFIFHGKFYLGLGSIIMLVTVILLTGYSLGCHSFRHLVGGGADCHSCTGGGPNKKFKVWSFATIFNEKHARWAWASLFAVWLTDIYIRLVAGGIIRDPHIGG